MKKILIIGASGNTGKLVCQFLSERIKEVKLVLGGRNLSKLARIKSAYCKRNVQVELREIDLDDQNTINSKLDDIVLVVNTGSLNPNADQLYRKLLDSGTDYMDSNLSFPSKHEKLNSLKSEIKEKGRTFITDCGYHPGIPAAMIRWGVKQFGDMQSAMCYAVMKMNWKELSFSKETGIEMMDEFSHYNPLHFDRKWKKWNLWKTINYKFESPFGKQTVTPMMMEELKDIPGLYSSLHKTGFFISGFNPILDYFVMPIIYYGVKVLPRKFYSSLARLFIWAAGFTQPPYGVQLICEFQKGQEKHKLILSHKDGYILTAMAIVACIEQYLNEDLPTGLHLQAIAVQTDLFFDALREMGCTVRVI